jgi:hypothetical protein
MYGEEPCFRRGCPSGPAETRSRQRQVRESAPQFERKRPETHPRRQDGRLAVVKHVRELLGDVLAVGNDLVHEFGEPVVRHDKVAGMGKNGLSAIRPLSIKQKAGTHPFSPGSSPQLFSTRQRVGLPSASRLTAVKSIACVMADSPVCRRCALFILRLIPSASSNFAENVGQSRAHECRSVGGNVWLTSQSLVLMMPSGVLENLPTSQPNCQASERQQCGCASRDLSGCSPRLGCLP